MTKQRFVIEIHDQSEDEIEDLAFLIEAILEDNLPPDVTYLLLEDESDGDVAEIG